MPDADAQASDQPAHFRVEVREINPKTEAGTSGKAGEVRAVGVGEG
jgi:hypothetical protein